MKIIIISDIHDNLPNLKKCLSWCKENKVEKIICAGDLTNSETLKFLAENFSGDIFLVRGNADNYDEDEIELYKNYIYGSRTAVWQINSFRVGVCHEPFLINEVLAKEKCEIVFYGHTHKPWIEKRGDAQVVNPGTLGGVFSPATFTIWEPASGKLELKLLATL
jgi:putative phosphoesterase